MARYIDAYAIKYFVEVTNDGRFYRVAFKDEIDKIPTADVVPMDLYNKILEVRIKKQENLVEVVRCKDCKYEDTCCRMIRNEKKPSDYCSYGEKKVKTA